MIDLLYSSGYHVPILLTDFISPFFSVTVEWLDLSGLSPLVATDRWKDKLGLKSGALSCSSFGLSFETRSETQSRSNIYSV